MKIKPESSEEKHGLLRHFSVGKVLQAVMMSICMSLMLAVFTPLDIVLNNQREFVLDYSYFAKAMILPAALIFFGTLAVSLISLLINKTAFKFVSMLYTGFTAACYIQELFLNGKMTDASNGTFLIDIPERTIIINVMIFAEIVLIPALLVLISAVRKKSGKMDSEKKEKKKDEPTVFARNILTILFAGMTLMQLTGFVTTYAKNNPEHYRSSYKDVLLFNYKKTASFSKDNNIVVFLVDRLDSFWTDELLEDCPEMKQELDGFTFYRNNISHYTHTFPSVSSMLTNNVYDKSEWYSYLDKVWQGDNALSDLRNNGYEVDLVLGRTTTYNLPESVLPYCDNFETPDNAECVVYNSEIRKTLLNLCAARVFPYALKDHFYKAVGNVTKQTFYEYKYDDFGSYAPFTTSTESDVKFLQFTKNVDFNADSPKKKFTFVHLYGAHDYNAELIKESGISLTHSDETIQTVAANFQSIKAYLDNAKKLGVYDNTTFIILSDHGVNPEIITDKKTGELIEPDVATLIIKPAGAEHGELKFDDISTLSNDMFSASILEYAGLDHSAYGDSYNDIITSGKTVTRYFMTFKWVDFGTAKPVETFEVTGDARDFSNWKKTS